MLTRLSKVRFISLAILIIMVLMSVSATAAAPLLASPGDVVINEIMQNPAAVGDDAGEWFELYNPTDSAIDIDSWTIKDNDYDSHVIDNGGPLEIPAGGYMVLGNNADAVTNGGITVDYDYNGGWFLSNSADEMVLLDATLTEIDRVEYDGGAEFPDPTGASMALSNPALDNNVGANWCTASTPYGDGDLGTPGAANDCPIVVPEVVINESMQNPAAVGDDAGEWFELYNPTDSAIDINSWTIKDNDYDSHVIDNGGPLEIPAGGYMVLGNNADAVTNGGVTVDYDYNGGWFLSNSADEMVLLDATLTEIDRVEYDGGAEFPDPTGASMALSNPALDNNVGANWCTASTPYGDGDLGTPGAANDCPLPVVEVVINEIIQNPSAVYDSAGEWFELYNPTANGIDINGWTIADNDYDSYVIANGGPLVIPAGGYLVLGNNDDSATNGGVLVDYQYSGLAIANGADEIVLFDSGSVEIDRVEYDGGPTFPDPNGASMALINPALDNNVGANWCEASTPYGDGDLGTPGAANDCPLPVVEVVINEIIQNPSAVYDSAGEWFELYNPTANGIDINGWTIADNDYDSYVIANGGPLVIPAGGYLVLGNNDDSATNGGVLVDYQYSGLAIANGADEIVLFDSGSVEIDRVEYDGGPTFPDPNGASMALINPALDNNVGANWCEASTPYGDGDLGTPGAANDCPPPGCGEPATFIHDVQGSGTESPLNGVPDVIVEGIVVGDFQDTSTQLRGFFLQEEDTDADADPSTSEGLFIYDYGFMDVSVGDVVRVKGSITEYWGLTEMNYITAMVVCGTGTATPAELTLPVPDLGEWEWYEGMLIHVPQTLYATGNYYQGRYGEVDLSVFGRLDNPTNVVDPGAPALALQNLNDRSRLQLEDGSTIQNPVPAPYMGVGNTLRAGDTLPGLTGVLHYSFEAYELHPTESVEFTRENDRPLDTPDVGGELKVASFNVLNYFTTIDDSGPICGPAGGMDCRGADTASEFTRQRDKIINAIVSMDADVIGLMEIENHPADAAVLDLVAGLNDVAGAGTYAYVATGPIGTDAIKVAMIYKTVSVTPVGIYAILDSDVDPAFLDTYNRPVLAQTFTDNDDALFTVAVNHLKSKGSDCNGIGDPDTGDGQGNCNLTRTAAAAALANWLGTDPTGSGDPDFLIIGDLNAYAMEDPVAALRDAGYTDLIQASLGVGAYSYVYMGQAGYLDHGLANGTMTVQVTGAAIWHINTDEPAALDYNDYNQADLYNPDPYRASDHDPVLIGLSLNLPPTADAGGPYYVMEGSSITLDASGTTDPDLPGDTLSFEWDFNNDGIFDDAFGVNPEFSAAGKDGPAILVVGLKVTDLAGLSDVTTADIVIENVAPTAEAGPDQTVNRNDVVLVEGSWIDPAGDLDDPYAWAWDLDGDGTDDDWGAALYGETVPATTSFGIEGFYTLTFNVTDNDEGFGSDTVLIEVLNQAPVCAEAMPSVDLLWPANHKFVSVEILGVTDPEGDTFTINIDSIFQDELVNDGGDGNTWPDGQGIGTSIAEVRAERAADGNGRVYHIAFTADDGHGGTCSGEVLVGVPHDSGKKTEPPVDDGPLYDSTLEPEAMILPATTEEPSDKDKKDK